MVFSSNVFLILFLPLAVSVYYLIIKLSKTDFKKANIWLLFVSLVFYAWGEPVYVLVMIGSVVFNYIIGRMLFIDFAPKTRKAILAVGCIVDIGVLFVFKYLQWLFKIDLNLALPIGISFYTFQAISFIVDIYRGGHTPEQARFINVGLYIAFFPQLIAGPIVRFSTVANQINEREHSVEKFSEGTWRFAKGLAKKVLLANQIAPVKDMAFSVLATNTVVMAWAGAIASVLQLYFDFSGYSDMAIGLGKMFGFEFNENFNYPFVSKSVSEYWRRWHISLGDWFRDYLFYPLSLGPAIKIRKKLNGKISARKANTISSVFVLSIVWLATGIWHGANLTFVLWGLIQLVFILFEQHIKPVKYLCHVKMVLVCIFGAVMFNATSVRHALVYYIEMFGLSGAGFCNGKTLYWLGQYAVTMVAGVVLSLPVIPAINKWAEKNSLANNIWTWTKTVLMIAFFAASVSYTIGAGYNPFIYFNF